MMGWKINGAGLDEDDNGEIEQMFRIWINFTASLLSPLRHPAAVFRAMARQSRKCPCL